MLTGDWFVVPFCVGTGLMAVGLVWKYIRWIRSFDRRQHLSVRRNILSWKFLPVLWESFREGLLHIRISRKNLLLGYMHRSLAFGWFLLIVVGAFQAFHSYGGSHPFHYAIFYNYYEPRTLKPGAQSAVIANLMDGLLLYVFTGLFLAVFKRIWSRPLGMKRTTKHSLIDRITKASLWMIFPMRLLAESVTCARFGNGGFLVRWVAGGIRTIAWNGGPQWDTAVLGGVEYGCWLGYSLCVGIFLTLMPFTRYMHIFTEVILIYFRTLGVKEGERMTGYTMMELSACSRCGICIDNCPINKELQITDTQGVYLLKALRNKEIFRSASEISEHCMMCNRCMEDCPVNIDLEKIRHQVRVEDKRGIDTSGNYGYIQNIRPFNAEGRVAFFGGCMSKLTPGIVESMLRIFEAAGVPYWYMDKSQNVCCGRPLYQQGLVRQAMDLRNKNAAMISQSGAVLLVTSCPICYQSFTKEYNLSIPVMHHTEYIHRLIQQGRLRPECEETLRVAYHDPCELGRGCGIYDAPREVLGSVATLCATASEREKSLCCGFNLGNTVATTDQQGLIRDAAYRNLAEVRPDVIATACPMCKKAFMHGPQGLPVKDVAELVCDALNVQKRNTL